jgi:hypothetical protein
MQKITFLFICLFAFLSVAEAKQPLPNDELSNFDKIWLARAMVAEAGWESKRDHVAIAYVLARRLKQMRKRWPHLQYRDVLFAYAKGLGNGRREYSPRQRWIRSLSPDLSKPDHWPRKARWERHKALWAATLTRADAWSRGRLRDPCRGRAKHWGGVNLVSDLPKGRMIKIDCGETKNIFYDLL